jgi:electron transfer flavoprotein beta subunit
LNVIVCIKRVPDTAAKIRIAADGRSIDPLGVEYKLNPYDEFALEEALRVREKAGQGQVTVLCYGPAEAAPVIRTALAMGADRAVHLKGDAPFGDGYAAASVLADALKTLPFDLLFFGKQAVDDDGHQVGVLVARRLGLPHVSVVTKFELDAAARRATVHRQVEGGEEVIEVGLPAAFTAQKGLNEPRFASLKGILAAKSKPVEERAVGAAPQRIVVEKLELPPARPPGRIVGQGAAAAPELVRLLREEAKVI